MLILHLKLFRGSIARFAAVRVLGSLDWTLQSQPERMQPAVLAAFKPASQKECSNPRYCCTATCTTDAAESTAVQ